MTREIFVFPYVQLLEEVRSDLHTQSNWEVLDRSKELAVMSLGHGDIIVSQELFTEVRPSDFIATVDPSEPHIQQVPHWHQNRHDNVC